MFTQTLLFLQQLTHTLINNCTYYNTHAHAQQFDDAQYSEVRKGPFYVPKSQTESSPPPPKPPHAAPSAGLAELDSLLELLNDTQQSIQGEAGEERESVCVCVCLALCRWNVQNCNHHHVGHKV